MRARLHLKASLPVSSSAFSLCLYVGGFRANLTSGAPIQIFHSDAQAFLSASTALYNRSPNLVRYKGRPPVKTTWLIEKRQPTQGGTLWFGEGVRLKHVPSGRYLAVEMGEQRSFCARELFVESLRS